MTCRFLKNHCHDFFDQLKSRTRGYASFDCEYGRYKQSDLVRLDILVNESDR